MTEASPGRMLRVAREKQGLHIAALAAAIKVAPRKLDALENDRWEDLPDASFTRALAQTVCRTLKIDPRPVLELLPAAATTLDHASNGLNTPFRRGRQETNNPAAIRPMVWAALALMAAAVVVYLLPDGMFQSRKPATAALPSESSAASVPPAVADAASGAGAETAAIAPFFSAGPMAASGVAAAAAPAAAGSEVAATAAVRPVLPAAASLASAAAAAPGAVIDAAAIVQLRTTQPSWVEVRDSRGSVLLSRLMQPGESVGFDRGLPLRLTIGNAAATQLTLRGRPVDLAGRSRDNVARFELQ